MNRDRFSTFLFATGLFTAALFITTGASFWICLIAATIACCGVVLLIQVTADT